MAPSSKSQFLRSSIWDRLTDRQSQHAAYTGNQSKDGAAIQDLDSLRRSIQKNLIHLLNSHVYFSIWPDDLLELDRSLVNYGIPDYTGTNMSLESDREKLRRSAERTIRYFEPRLSNVKVSVVPTKDKTDRTLCLRIEAEYGTKRDPIAFDSQLDPIVKKFAVTVPGQ